MTASAQRAREVADAVLYEGYLLYPYTASALKNQLRWQFGVLMPQGYADASEPNSMTTEILCRQTDASDPAGIEIVARFLEAAEAPATREVAMQIEPAAGKQSVTFGFGELHGELDCEPIADGDYVRCRVTLKNESCVDPGADRITALGKALIGAHALLSIERGCFISLLDPPDAAKDAAARCVNRRVFPVLIGEAGTGGQTAAMVLASPIILYDFPALSPQSPGHTFDSTEIDELLLLSVASLTDEEKREARATDPRARAIVDRADALTAGAQMHLHGIMRAGARVRVHPKRSADAFDMFAAWRTARVKGVHEDVDGRRYVAVIFDDDPASDLHEWYGRSFFYELDEIQPLEGAP